MPTNDDLIALLVLHFPENLEYVFTQRNGKDNTAPLFRAKCHECHVEFPLFVLGEYPLRSDGHPYERPTLRDLFMAHHQAIVEAHMPEPVVLWRRDDEPTEIPDEALERAVYEALGAASSCWEHMEGTGVFDSERAHQTGVELLAAIRAWREQKDEAPDAPPPFPYQDGDFTVIGPECFATVGGQVLCWKGVNYVPQAVGDTVTMEYLDGRSESVPATRTVAEATEMILKSHRDRRARGDRSPESFATGGPVIDVAGDDAILRRAQGLRPKPGELMSEPPRRVVRDNPQA